MGDLLVPDAEELKENTALDAYVKRLKEKEVRIQKNRRTIHLSHVLTVQ